MSILWHITSLLLLCSCTPGFCMQDGIVGGKDSVPHSRPYMVYIRDKVSKQACGGFLIRKDFVMTAAHCNQSNLMVYLGVDDTKRLPDGIEVDPIPHPKFNMNTTGHDIMLLKLKTPATLNEIVSTIALPKPENEGIFKDCMVMGWGWKKYYNESPSNVLKEATVTVIDSENCGTADTLCTEGSTGPAQGDSGGPLVCGGVAQGIVSFYKNHTNANYKTSVYTHISHYFSWIHDKMKPPTQQQYETWKGKLDKLYIALLVVESPFYTVDLTWSTFVTKYQNKRGGFLVTEDYMMTAAHCIQGHLMVYLGVDDTNRLPDGIEVDPIPHPKFSMKRTGHDIMLLKLKTPATLNKNMSTITLPKPENEGISKDCMVMGWGWKKYYHESPSNVLKEANVTLMNSENCGMADTLCTEGSTGPAQGDSGGPLVCGGVAQGIVSFSKNHTNANYITRHTHISHYFSWINDNMIPPTQLAI